MCYREVGLDAERVVGSASGCVIRWAPLGELSPSRAWRESVWSTHPANSSCPVASTGLRVTGAASFLAGAKSTASQHFSARARVVGLNHGSDVNIVSHRNSDAFDGGYQLADVLAGNGGWTALIRSREISGHRPIACDMYRPGKAETK